MRIFVLTFIFISYFISTFSEARFQKQFNYSAVKNQQGKLYDQYFLYNKTVRVTRNLTKNDNYLQIYSSFGKRSIEQFYQCDSKFCKRTKFKIYDKVSRNQLDEISKELPQPDIAKVGCISNYVKNNNITDEAIEIRKYVFDRFAKSEMQCDSISKEKIYESFKHFLKRSKDEAVRKCVSVAQSDNKLLYAEIQNIEENKNPMPFDFECNYKNDENFHASIELLSNKIIIPVPTCWDDNAYDKTTQMLAHEFSHFINPNQVEAIAKKVGECFSKKPLVKVAETLVDAKITAAKAAETQVASVNTKTDAIIPAETPGLDRTSSAPPIALWNQVMGMVSRANAEVIKQYGEDPFHVPETTLATLPKANTTRSKGSTTTQPTSRTAGLQYTATGEAIRPDIPNNELYANGNRKADLKKSPTTADVAKIVPTSGSLVAQDDSQFTPDPMPVSGTSSKSSNSNMKTNQATRNIASTGSSGPSEAPQEILNFESALNKAQSSKEIEKLSVEIKKQNILIILNKKMRALIGGKSQIGNPSAPKKRYIQTASGKLELASQP